MANGRSKEFKTPTCRLSFAQGLFKPRSQSGGPEKFGATLIFPNSTNRAAFDAAVKEAVTEAWGDKGLQKVQNGLIKTPFLKGDGKEARSKESGELHGGMGPDVWFVRVQANADHPPVVRFRSPTIPATEAEVYSGCYGFAVLNAFAWSNAQNGDGVSFGIAFFQKTADGDRLGGGGPVDVSKYFEKIADTGEAASGSADQLFG